MADEAEKYAERSVEVGRGKRRGTWSGVEDWYGEATGRVQRSTTVSEAPVGNRD